MKYASIIYLSLIVLAAGCHWPGGRSADESSGPGYEIAWVEPQMILSDSVCTLIRADRIDSFPSEMAKPRVTPSLIFEVVQPACPVTVTLHDIYGAEVASVLAQRLAPGFYQLTISPAFRESRRLPAGPYLLIYAGCSESAEARVYLP